MLGVPDVRIGLIGFTVDKGIDAMESAFPVGRSLLMSGGRGPGLSGQGQLQLR